MSDLIERQAAIDTLNVGEELLRRVLDEMEVVGNEREKFAWGLGLIEAYIADIKDLPPAQPDLQPTCNQLATNTISRQAAIDEITEYGSGNTIYMSVAELKRRIEHLPSAQPERCEDCGNFNKTRLLIPQPEIVRCKECKHRFVDSENVRFNVCELNHNKVQADDWYCADAERREE